VNRYQALNIVLILAIVVSLASLTAHIIGYRLGHLLPAGKGSGPVAQSPSTPEDLASFAAILEKGLFGKATAGKLTPIVRESAAAAAATTPVTDLVLLGTAIGSFRETFALIQKTSSKEERVFRLGEKVYDAGPLLAVKADSIDIDLSGKRTPVFMPNAAPPQAAGTSATPSGTMPGTAVAQTGAGSFVIDQKALNATLDNLGQAMTDARLLPSMKDGKVEGFKISEVKPAGVFGMVGIRNGDVLLRINDFAIDSPEKAIQSLAALKGQTRLKLDLVRDGQPATFNYDIR
jgi:general secretion pathway protein C